MIAGLQPSTAIWVLWFSVAPFCPTKSVGIFSALCSVHKLPFAANALNFPCGRFNSNVSKGTSGVVLKLVLVIPDLLIKVVPTRSTVTP